MTLGEPMGDLVFLCEILMFYSLIVTAVAACGWTVVAWRNAQLREKESMCELLDAVEDELERYQDAFGELPDANSWCGDDDEEPIHG